MLQCTLGRFYKGVRCLLRQWSDNKINQLYLNGQHLKISHKASSNLNYATTLLCDFGKREEKPFEIHSIWLRHHCQCDQCFNSKTNQRVRIPSDLPLISTATKWTLEADQLVVTWNDGHESKYGAEWLRNNAPKPRSELSSFHQHQTENFIYQHLQNTNPELLFTRTLLERQANPIENAIPFKDFMKSGDEGVRKLLKNILQHGYGIVIECPVDFETTKKVISQVSHPQNTLFGDYSEWTSDLAHADTAYTTDIVHLHTDTSYFTEPVGLQIFHCLKHDGTGGVNFLADGFQIARQMSRYNYEYYMQLASVNVPSQYIDPGKHHFFSNDVVFGHDWIHGKLAKIRYNPHDMAVLNQLPFDSVATFYESIVYFSDLLENDPQTIKLTPGLVIFLDNWRTLHGRSAFTGFRHLCGAYISRSDWLSRAKTLGVL